MSPMVGSARKIDERWTQRIREKLEKKKKQKFREIVAQVKIRLDY